mmetsp:Transcript_118201/g.341728  ORF Transcript_118201/g.341728 Transcript_118201/m.341728 type:complete len:250 (+) Transcript_118201:379-1128(+)
MTMRSSDSRRTQRSAYMGMKWCCAVAFSKTSCTALCKCLACVMPQVANCSYNASNFSTVNLFKIDLTVRKIRSSSASSSTEHLDETSHSPNSPSLLDPSEDATGERTGQDAQDEEDAGPCVESSSLVLPTLALPVAQRLRRGAVPPFLQGANAKKSETPRISGLSALLKLHTSDWCGVEGSRAAPVAADFLHAAASLRSAEGLTSSSLRRPPPRRPADGTCVERVLAMASPWMVAASPSKTSMRAIAAR